MKGPESVFDRFKDNRERSAPLPLVNERIRARHVQLITYDGKNQGVVSRDEALSMARSLGLDLVLLSDPGVEGTPIAKIMDFGKSQYAKKKKQAEAKKKQKVIKIKEIRLTPKIGEHDFQTKINQGVGFLREGMRLKVTLVFRGREMQTLTERGGLLFSRVDKALQEAGLTAGSEADQRMGKFWSRVYYLRDGK